MTDLSVMSVSFETFLRLVSHWRLWLSAWCFILMQAWAEMAMLKVHVAKSFNCLVLWPLFLFADAFPFACCQRKKIAWHMTMTKPNWCQSNNETKVEISLNLSQLLIVDEALAKLSDPNHIHSSSSHFLSFTDGKNSSQCDLILANSSNKKTKQEVKNVVRLHTLQVQRARESDLSWNGDLKVVVFRKKAFAAS